MRLTRSSSLHHPTAAALLIGLLGCLLLTAAMAFPPGPAAYRISTIAGTGAATLAPGNIGQPFGVEIGPDGWLYITEVQNHRVLKLDMKTGSLQTVAGTGVKGYSGDGGPATKAELNEPYEIRFDKAGNLYFVEMMNHLVRRIDAATGVITTLAGTGKAGFSGDGGPATKAMLRQPHSIALDDAGNLYIADIGNHRIRMLNLTSGIITTLAGDGSKTLPTDGGKAAGPMVGPRALFYREGSLWIALREGHSVWRLDLKGRTVHHLAGTGKAGYSGDGGAAKLAAFNGPKGIALDKAGNIALVDTENQAIRWIEASTGLVHTIAGSGPSGRGFGGDEGAARAGKMDRPHGIGFGPDGALYIGDTNNHRIRKLFAAP